MKCKCGVEVQDNVNGAIYLAPKPGDSWDSENMGPRPIKDNADLIVPLPSHSFTIVWYSFCTLQVSRHPMFPPIRGRVSFPSNDGDNRLSVRDGAERKRCKLKYRRKSNPNHSNKPRKVGVS